ncbi:hypothetical protein B0H17DRAFT_1062578, partial [Mycena rosella]
MYQRVLNLGRERNSTISTAALASTSERPQTSGTAPRLIRARRWGRAQPLAPAAPATSLPECPAPLLTGLTRLTPHHRTPYLGCILLLPRTLIARAFAGLLSPSPGFVLFGTHVGLRMEGVQKSFLPPICSATSPESWAAILRCSRM